VVVTVDWFTTGITDGLTRLRALALARMRATVRVTRPGAAVPVTLPDGTVEPAPAALVYEGPGRLALRAQSGFFEAKPYAAAHYATVAVESLHLPVGTPVQVNDLVEVLVDADTPTNVGRRFVIKTATAGSQTTALRCNIEEKTLG